MKRLTDFFPIILFSVLSFVIVLPLLAPGYILTMDIAFTPNLPISAFTSSTFFLSSLMRILNLVIPSYVLQKIMLFLVFFLSGWSMYRLVSKKYRWVGIFGGIFYAINPFVYERVMAGQWQFLLGYSILPFAISAIIDFFDCLQKKDTVILAIWTFVLINLAVHFSLIIVFLLLIYGFTYIYFNPEKIRVIGRPLILFSVIVILLNANWLLPTILGRSGVSQAIGLFDSSDLNAFQSVPDKNLGLIFNLLSGFGFWPEAYDYFISPKRIIFFWPILSFLFILLSLYGLFKMFVEKKKSSFPLLMTLVVLFLISLDLAGGVALKSFSDIVYYLYEIFPPLRGFREPQKLIGITMLCYSFFGSMGIYYLGGKTAWKTKAVIIGTFIILPFIYTPTIFASFWGQLKPVFYPSSWGKVNQILKEDKGDFLTVFFPWHQYIRFKFAHNMVVANPSTYFFDKPILTAQNYETKYLDTHDIRMEALHVDGLMSIEKNKVNLLGEQVNKKIVWGEDLALINVKYIILAKEKDQKLYQFLDRSPDLEKIFEDDNLILYKNNRWSLDSNGETQQVVTYTQEDLVGLDKN